MAKDKYLMLYCDNPHCRVNTFERGDGSDRVIDHRPGLCPGCSREGYEIQ